MNKERIGKLLDEWIEQQRLSEYEFKTLQSYKSDLNKFINYIDTEEFVLDKNLTIKYKDYLKNNHAVTSCNRYIVSLNKFLKYLDLKECTVKKLQSQLKTSINDPIWEQEHKRMLRWSKILGMEDMYLILKIFAYTGIRVEELDAFKVENLNNYIQVFKKGKYRTVILRNDLLRELRLYCRTNKIKVGYVFKSPKKSGVMLNPSTVWRRLKTIAKAAKINPDKIHPHAWRHLFAKNFIKDPENDITELADILGHSKLDTTRIYTTTSNKEKKAKLEKIKY